MFEVVVIASRLVKDVHDDVAVVKRNPLTRRPAFDVLRLHAQREFNEPLDLLGDSAHLAVGASRRHDQSVKRVHELAQIEYDGVLTQLLVGTTKGGVKKSGDER